MKSGNRGLPALLALLTLASGCSMFGAGRPAAVDPASQTVAAASAGAVMPELRPEVPAAAAALWSRADSAMQLQDWSAARAALGQLTLDYPGFAGPYVNLAIIYRHEGDDEARENALVAATAIAPNHAVANNELGMLFRQRGEFGAAEEAYRRAIAGNRDYANAHYNLAVLLDVYMQRRDEAVTHYEVYQELLNEPDPQVGFWIVDLKRRLAVSDQPMQVAQGDMR